MLRAIFLLAPLWAVAAVAAEPAVTIPVAIAKPAHGDRSGRLLVFVKKLADPAKPDRELGFDPFTPTATSIAGREISDAGSGKVVIVDGETDVFPAALSSLPPGTYAVQALLDRNHDYDYHQRGPGDLVSKVAVVSLPGPMPTLVVDSEIGPDDAAVIGVQGPDRATALAWQPKLKPIEFQSPMLTRFRGTPTFIRGWVALPPGYDGRAKFPTVYTFAGFYGSIRSARAKAAVMMANMATGKLPPMIWVYLDQESGTGTHEFSDSANNGPWGSALTSELIPALERQYRMDATASGRFLTGQSSGGWASLWLQTKYPKLFGGAWATAPDASDFHSFVNVDIYAPDANLYRDGAGTPYPLARDGSNIIATVEQFTRAEWAMGEYGGQMSSFDWVFSPRGVDGRPLPLADRATGRIDPAVAAYWRDNYDIAHIVQRDWRALKPDLDGKIHVIVGTADTFYLDGPAKRLEAVFRSLGAKADFRFVPGKNHFNLGQRGDDPLALTRDITGEMYAIARPHSRR
jgi:S-formylglutathione hydrolase FrmB